MVSQKDQWNRQNPDFDPVLEDALEWAVRPLSGLTEEPDDEGWRDLVEDYYGPAPSASPPAEGQRTEPLSDADREAAEAFLGQHR